MPVTEDGTEETLGTLSQLLINPDTGKIEGCFALVPGFFRSQHLFISVMDIVRFSTRIYVRHSEVLFPIEEHIRLLPLHLERRTLLRQQVRTETGKFVGWCQDIQFDTRHFMVEWIFPRKFFRWGTPLPLSSIIEVRKDAIIVRDTSVREKEAKVVPTLLEQLPIKA